MMPLTPDIIEATIRRNFAALNARDADAWLATFAPDAVSHDPVGANARTGHSELRSVIEGLATFREIDFIIHHLYVCANEAAVQWSARCVTVSGEKTATFDGIDTFVFNETGVITETRAYWNPALLSAQLA